MAEELPPPQQLAPGTRVGHWELLAELARGGMGVVWRARDPTGREVALKLLLDHAQGAPERRARLVREARALARLRHRHIVAVLDVGQDEGLPWVALELLAGETLAARLTRQGPIAPPAAVALARKLVDAIAHAHEQGVLHRDLKPGNVLLRPDGEPVLLDFGLARDVDPEEGRLGAALTLPGRLLGTPGFWSPEQAQGDLPRIGPATDVWGLGALLVALLIAEPPLGSPSSILDAVAATEQPVAPPSARNPGVDPALDAICLTALALDPAARYPDARALDEDLARWERGEPPRLATAPRAGRARDVVQVALVLLAGLIALGLTAHLAGSAPAPAATPTPTPAATPGPAPTPAATPGPAPTPAAAPGPGPTPGPALPEAPELPRGRTSWSGWYACTQGRTRLELTLEHEPWTQLEATFAFSADPSNPDVPSGRFRLRGRWDPATRRVELTPVAWEESPGETWVMVGLSGKLTPDGQRLEGKVSHESCGAFQVERVPGGR